MARLKCEVCGQRVSVYTSQGGTSSYEPEAEKIIESLTKALEKIRDCRDTSGVKSYIPEENCGTCKYNDKKCSCERENCCYANEGLVLITNNDFCSRWGAK